MDGKSLNITQENINQLKQIFPEIVKEDKVDFIQLKVLLGEEVLAKDESYGLSWAGKYEAFKEIQKQTTATLIPEREGSIDFDTAENIFIEGENLEVLRVLQKSYYGKIKMIYIDPPYNTGNDFIYNDKFAEHKTEYLKKIGAIDHEGNVVNASLYQQNTRESGRFHSIWLSFMYPRLYLAKNLLREDGVIFISIDDNEVHNLRLLMDEIFGEDCFISEVIWKKKHSYGRGQTFIIPQTEYILCYAKDKNNATDFGISYSEKKVDEFKHSDKKGKYRLLRLWHTAPRGAYERTTLQYKLYTPDGLPVDSVSGQWLWNEKRMCDEIAKNNVVFIKQTDGTNRAFKKDYLNEDRKEKPTSLYDKATTDDATKEFNFLLPDVKETMFTKPTKLIKDLINWVNLDVDDIVLDFFAGSGTTAQAVMELNEEDEGNCNRKFICVQLNEKCKETGEAYKAGYKTIADITKARIIKVIQNIEKKRNGTITLNQTKQKLAFKYYKLSDSNFKKWNNAVDSEIALTQQLQFHINSAKDGSTIENMLHELLLKLGVPLTTEIEKQKSFFYLADYKICICLQLFNTEIRNQLFEMKPRQTIVLDNLFENDEFLSNTQLLFSENNIELTVI